MKDSCLDEDESKQVMKILYEYKDVFSLRDEIGMCPNIEVNIEVMDNLPSFIRPCHVKEEDRAVLDKEMRRLCYFGNIKGRFFSILESCNVDQSKTNLRKKSCDRFEGCISFFVTI